MDNEWQQPIQSAYLQYVWNQCSELLQCNQLPSLKRGVIYQIIFSSKVLKEDRFEIIMRLDFNTVASLSRKDYCRSFLYLVRLYSPCGVKGKLTQWLKDEGSRKNWCFAAFFVLLRSGSFPFH